MPTVEEAKAAVEKALEEKATGEDIEKKDAEDAKEEEGATVEDEVVETEEDEIIETPRTVPITRFNEVYGRMKELERIVVDLTHDARERPRRKEESEEEFPDFERMTPKEIAKWNQNQIRKTVKDVVSELVEPVMKSSKEDRALKMIEAAAAKYPDFYDYKDTILDYGRKHPTLTPEEAYILAKRDNPAAMKSVAKRLQDKVKQKKAARTETRSTPGEKTVENPVFKNVKEAAYAQAKKLGLV